jgi:predicted glycosyltransferase
MTGSPVAERFATPAGLTVVRLPPVVKVGNEDYRSRDPRWSIDLVRRTRSAIMIDTARRFRPDVFLVDHAPQGMKQELLPVYEVIRLSSPATRIVLGLRDVLDEPVRVRENWSALKAYDTLETVFDRILVYGSAELFDVVTSYGLSCDVAAKLTYCGYISRPANRRVAQSPEEGFVLGIAGGGGDGAVALSATLEASAALRRASLVVTGPLMSESDRRALENQAALDPRATVTEFIADLDEAMSRASAVVTMGGYNSLCELVANGVPTIVIPRIHPRREQAIRADLFHDLGVVSVVAPGEGLAERLRASLADTLAVGRREESRGLDLNGLEQIDAALEAEARVARGYAATPMPRADTDLAGRLSA